MKVAPRVAAQKAGIEVLKQSLGEEEFHRLRQLLGPMALSRMVDTILKSGRLAYLTALMNLETDEERT